MNREIRQYPAAPHMEGDGNTLVGYAALFNSPSQLLHSQGKRFTEVIKPGAFRAALGNGKDIKALVGHIRGQLLGRTKSGTLKLSEDSQGLRYELTLPDTTLGRDLKEMVKRGDISGASFGFHIAKGGDSWKRAADGNYLREVNSFSGIDEISFVDDPAYEDTSVALRHLQDIEAEESNILRTEYMLKRQQLSEW